MERNPLINALTDQTAQDPHGILHGIVVMFEEIAQDIQPQWFLGDQQQRQHGLPNGRPTMLRTIFDPLQRDAEKVVRVLFNPANQTGRIDHGLIAHRIGSQIDKQRIALQCCIEVMQEAIRHGRLDRSPQRESIPFAEWWQGIINPMQNLQRFQGFIRS